MNLHSMLEQRARDGNLVRIGLIGAGKFGAMFLAQARRTLGFQVVGIADLAVDRARATLARIGWPDDAARAGSLDAALSGGGTWLTDDAAALTGAPAIDVVIDATGVPEAGIRHATAAIAAGKHVVMVNVEADVLAGPLLAEQAAAAGVVYSMAYGDQPAMISEMVDWARTAGFRVVCAGKGTKYLPAYHSLTPDTVWERYGITPEDAEAGGMNAQMFNSFMDGTKSAIEMAAVANACGLQPAEAGLAFPPCGADDLARVLRPAADGGNLQRNGTVEVVSSLERDGRPVFRDLRWGVYVVFEAPDPYVARCFAEYGLATDPTGRFAAMYKPYHLIGLELGISVANAALRGEATGSAREWNGDAVAVAKRGLAAGERLDGEGGYTVWGKLMPAAASLASRALPIGLAHGIDLIRDVPEGAVLSWDDVAADGEAEAFKVRRAMEQRFAGRVSAAAE